MSATIPPCSLDGEPNSPEFFVKGASGTRCALPLTKNPGLLLCRPRRARGDCPLSRHFKNCIKNRLKGTCYASVILARQFIISIIRKVDKRTERFLFSRNLSVRSPRVIKKSKSGKAHLGISLLRNAVRPPGACKINALIILHARRSASFPCRIIMRSPRVQFDTLQVRLQVRLIN